MSSTGNATAPATTVHHTHPFEPYGYVPTEWICIMFIVLYAVTTMIHFTQAIYYRLWWLLGTTVLAGIAELIGWSGRLWSSFSPFLLDPYLMQFTTTVLAPTPLIAANFIILGHVNSRLGQQYSRLSAKWYTIIFLFCDVVSLIIQAVGGAKASFALHQHKSTNLGGHITLAGIVFQLAAFTTYLSLATEFLWRYYHGKPIGGSRAAAPLKHIEMTNGIKFMILGLALDGLLILIRSGYRTVELSDGFTGRIITTEVYFNVLDGGMIVLAMYTLNLFHPGRLMGLEQDWDCQRDGMGSFESEEVELASQWQGQKYA